MSAFFTNHIAAQIALNQNALDGRQFRVALFRYAPAMGVTNPTWQAARTVAELVATSPGWVEVSDVGGYPFTPPNDTVIDMGSRISGASRYIMYNKYPFAELEEYAEVSALGIVLVGALGGVTDPLIFVSNTPLSDLTNIRPGDALTSNPDTNLSGDVNRWLLSWAIVNVMGAATNDNDLLTKSPVVDDVYLVSSTNHWWKYKGPNPNDNLSKWADMGVAAVNPVEGPLVIALGSPEFEVSGSQHAWLYPHVNMIANPSFEAPGMDYWSSNGTMTRVQEAAPGGGYFSGQFTGSGAVVAESNTFSTQLGEIFNEQWTVQLMVKGTGKFKIGFIYWDADYRATATNWGEDGEEWILSPDSWLHIAVHRHAPEAHLAMVRVECLGGSFKLDKVLAEPGYLKEWLYFDGDEKYGARDDFSWYGGIQRQGASYSLWYNHRNAVIGRLFARSVDPNDPTQNVTDEDMEEQGLVYRWVPAGITVVPHMDVLFPFDLQSSIPPKPAGVLPYFNATTAPDGVSDPWHGTRAYWDELPGWDDAVWGP